MYGDLDDNDIYGPDDYYDDEGFGEVPEDYYENPEAYTDEYDLNILYANDDDYWYEEDVYYDDEDYYEGEQPW